MFAMINQNIELGLLFLSGGEPLKHRIIVLPEWWINSSHPDYARAARIHASPVLTLLASSSQKNIPSLLNDSTSSHTQYETRCSILQMKTSQELRMLSPVALNWRVAMNIGTFVLNCQKFPQFSEGFTNCKVHEYLDLGWGTHSRVWLAEPKYVFDMKMMIKSQNQEFGGNWRHLINIYQRHPAHFDVVSDRIALYKLLAVLIWMRY